MTITLGQLQAVQHDFDQTEKALTPLVEDIIDRVSKLNQRLKQAGLGGWDGSLYFLEPNEFWSLKSFNSDYVEILDSDEDSWTFSTVWLEDPEAAWKEMVEDGLGLIVSNLANRYESEKERLENTKLNAKIAKKVYDEILGELS